MTAIDERWPLNRRRKQRVRNFYAELKQLRDELNRDPEGWGDVADEIQTAMDHLETADRMLSDEEA